MLTRLYIEALLADAEAADEAWEAWDCGEISDFVAVWAWWLISKKLSDVALQLGLGGYASEAE